MGLKNPSNLATRRRCKLKHRGVPVLRILRSVHGRLYSLPKGIVAKLGWVGPCGVGWWLRRAGCHKGSHLGNPQPCGTTPRLGDASKRGWALTGVPWGVELQHTQYLCCIHLKDCWFKLCLCHLSTLLRQILQVKLELCSFLILTHFYIF